MHINMSLYFSASAEKPTTHFYLVLHGLVLRIFYWLHLLLEACLWWTHSSITFCSCLRTAGSCTACLTLYSPPPYSLMPLRYPTALRLWLIVTLLCSQSSPLPRLRMNNDWCWELYFPSASTLHKDLIAVTTLYDAQHSWSLDRISSMRVENSSNLPKLTFRRKFVAFAEKPIPSTCWVIPRTPSRNTCRVPTILVTAQYRRGCRPMQYTSGVGCGPVESHAAWTSFSPCSSVEGGGMLVLAWLCRER
jgi:hypothetical protein